MTLITAFKNNTHFYLSNTNILNKEIETSISTCLPIQIAWITRKRYFCTNIFVTIDINVSLFCYAQWVVLCSHQNNFT